jgi:hypothetical protein
MFISNFLTINHSESLYYTTKHTIKKDRKAAARHPRPKKHEI